MMGLGGKGAFSLSGDAYFGSVIISIVMVIVNFVAGIV